MRGREEEEEGERGYKTGHLRDLRGEVGPAYPPLPRGRMSD